MTAKRINDSLLGALERPTLAWMVQTLPKWVTPDQLTAFGFIGALVAAAGYIASSWSIQFLWFACLGLTMNWWGDSLDGTLARYRSIERPRYGFFVDQTSDIFSQALLFLALGASPCTHFAISCLGLIALQMALAYSLIVLHVRDSYRITYLGIGITEIRVLLIAGNLIFLVAKRGHAGGFSNVIAYPLPPWTIFDVVICLLAGSAMLTFSMLAVAEGMRLRRVDHGSVSDGTSKPSQ